MEIRSTSQNKEDPPIIQTALREKFDHDGIVSLKCISDCLIFVYRNGETLYEYKNPISEGMEMKYEKSDITIEIAAGRLMNGMGVCRIKVVEGDKKVLDATRNTNWEDSLSCSTWSPGKWQEQISEFADKERLKDNKR